MMLSGLARWTAGWIEKHCCFTEFGVADADPLPGQQPREELVPVRAHRQLRHDFVAVHAGRAVRAALEPLPEPRDLGERRGVLPPKRLEGLRDSEFNATVSAQNLTKRLPLDACLGKNTGPRRHHGLHAVHELERVDGAPGRAAPRLAQ